MDFLVDFFFWAGIVCFLLFVGVIGLVLVSGINDMEDDHQ